MIWIIEIPIIVFVIIGMLVGSIQVGTILRVVGIIMLIASLVWLAVVKSNESDERDQSAVAIFSLFRDCWCSFSEYGLESIACLNSFSEQGGSDMLRKGRKKGILLVHQNSHKISSRSQIHTYKSRF